MFTGIIESIGRVEDIKKKNGNFFIKISSKISKDLNVNQSLSHDGVCLTIINSNNNFHDVAVVKETLIKSTFKNISIGGLINLERSLLVNSRFDGHVVQGHVDEVAECIKIKENKNNWVFNFKILNINENLIVEKGSITINGVSLTCYDIKECVFSVSIIPHTFQNTNFSKIKEGDKVNIEYDILGKYLNKMYSKNKFLNN